MSLKHTTVKLSDGKEYQICAFGAIKGYGIAQKISKVIMTPLSKMEGAEMNMITIMAVVLDNLDEIDSLGLLKELINTVTVDGKDIDFDTYFNANYGILIDLIFEVCKFNFESFFTSGVFQGNQ